MKLNPCLLIWGWGPLQKWSESPPKPGKSAFHKQGLNKSGVKAPEKEGADRGPRASPFPDAWPNPGDTRPFGGTPRPISAVYSGRSPARVKSDGVTPRFGVGLIGLTMEPEKRNQKESHFAEAVEFGC